MTELTGRYDSFFTVIDDIELDREDYPLAHAFLVHKDDNEKLKKVIETIRQNGMTPDDISLVNNVGSLCTRSFKTTIIELIADTPDEEDYPEIVSNIITSKNNDRANMLSAVIDRNAFDIMTDEDIAGLTELLGDESFLTEEYPTMIELATQVYKGLLEEDLKTFIRIVKELDLEKPTLNTRKIISALGKHMLDAAKISAGVAAGVIIAHRFNK